MLKTKNSRIREKKNKKEKEKEHNNGRKESIKKIIRKDKSFTIISKLKKKLINEDNSNINKNKLKLNNNNYSESSKSNKEKNDLNIKKVSEKPSSTILSNNNEQIETKRSDIRRNSTRDLREKNNKDREHHSYHGHSRHSFDKHRERNHGRFEYKDNFSRKNSLFKILLI